MEGVAGIAVVAATHSDGYAATGHLLGLPAALPSPTKAGERFWSTLEATEVRKFGRGRTRLNTPGAAQRRLRGP